MMSGLKPNVAEHGFAVMASCLDDGTVDVLGDQLDENRHAQRNLLSVPIVRELATSKPVREIVETILGPKCFAVRESFSTRHRSQTGRSFGTKI
jgi:hypothetical protein